MKVAITISSLPQLSTNQLVGLSVAEELERLGHGVDLFCVGRITPERISAVLGKELKARIFHSRWLWAPGSTIYDYPILATLLGGYRGYDFTFEAIGPVIHVSTGRTADVTYVFFPPDPDLMGDGKFRRGFWWLYSLPYRAFYAAFSNNVRSTRLLTISTYVADLCKAAWQMDSEVVYFPVPIKAWLLEREASQRDGVITIGRFSVEKRQIEQVRIAEALVSLGVTSPFSIIGAVASPISERLLLSLRKEALTRGIRGLNFYPNLTGNRVIALAQRSKVFLHTMRDEHFGIATVEAIAAGCVPIVHDSGGSREIVPFRELRFQSESEAVEKVHSALEGSYDRLLPKLKEHISGFSEGAFKVRVTKILLSEASRRGCSLGHAGSARG